MPEPLDETDPRQVGPYALLNRLGDGGMGSVYQGQRVDVENAPIVAVKVIRADLGRLVEFRSRFLQEARAAQRVAPFCTAEVLDVDTEGPRPYIVTEFIDGPTLAARVRVAGPLPDRDLERLAVNVAAALYAIHSAGIVHRDLKPGNIMMSSSGARVIDFGIARAYDATTMLTHGPIGTPAFMAPEQARGETVTAAADIHAWGATLLFAATGRPPFEGDSASGVMRAVEQTAPDLTGVPGNLRPLVARAMAKNPADRPTADELHAALPRVLGGLATGDPVTPTRVLPAGPPGAPPAAVPPPPAAGPPPFPTPPGPLSYPRPMPPYPTPVPYPRPYPASVPRPMPVPPPVPGPMLPRPVPPAARGRGARRVRWVAFLGSFAVNLVYVTTAFTFPAVQKSLSLPDSDFRWIADGPTLTFCAFLVLAGSLVNRMGARAGCATGMGIFVVSLVLGAVAPSREMMIFLLLVVGVSEAVFTAATLALIWQTPADTRSRAKAIGAWVSGGVLAQAAGRVALGALTEQEVTDHWQLISGAAVPFALLALLVLLSARSVPRYTGPFDWLGQSTLFVAVGATAYALFDALYSGWGHPAVLVLLPVAFVAFLGFLVTQSLNREPLLPGGLARSVRLLAALAAAMLATAGFAGANLALATLPLPQFRDGGRVPAEAVAAAIAMLVAVAVGSRLARAVMARTNAVAPALVGLAFEVVGFAGLAALPTPSSLGDVAWWTAPIGIGFGFVVVPVVTFVLERSPAPAVGLLAGLVASFVQIGLLIGNALFAARSSRVSADVLAGGPDPGYLQLTGQTFVVFPLVAVIFVVMLAGGEKAAGPTPAPSA